MQRWARVVGSDDHLDLAEHLSSSVLVSSNNVQCTDTFAIQTHVLGVGLGHQHIESLLSEVPYWEGITNEVTTGKTLISRIEVREELLLLHNLSYLLPLIAGGVHTGWVMSTHVQQHNVTRLGLAQCVNELADQSFVGLGIVVGILGELQSRSLDDVMVVCPGWVRNKHLRWNPFVEELKPHPQRAGT